MKPRTKSERLRAIKQIIESMEISTQEDLMSELEKRGYEVTQATVSRDISDMGLLKVKLVSINEDMHAGVHPGRQVYSLPHIERLRSLLNDFMISIDRADNQIVLKTTPGMAQAVAAAIDAAQWQDVLGTVGGDDTILIIARNKEIATGVVGRMKVLHEEKTY